MSKVFKATFNSKKTQHPEGDKTVVVYVSDKMKKHAAEKAADELAFWDPENHSMYKMPKMEECSEDDLTAYLSEKEQAGQVEIANDKEPATIFDAERAIKLHPDYFNCADPDDVSYFINHVMDNVSSVAKEADGTVCFDTVVDHINSMASLRDLMDVDYIIDHVIAPAIKSEPTNLDAVKESVKGHGDDIEGLVEAGPNAPDYAKPADRRIEVAHFKLDASRVLKIGVGTYEGKFLSSIEVCLVEKETGVMHTQHGKVTMFDDRVFDDYENAISNSFGMAVDFLMLQKEALEKNFMLEDANKLGRMIDRFANAETAKLFKDNIQSGLALIPQFCTMPIKLKYTSESVEKPEMTEVTASNEVAKAEVAHDSEYVKMMTDYAGFDFSHVVFGDDYREAEEIIDKSNLTEPLKAACRKLVDIILCDLKHENTLVPSKITGLFVSACNKQGCDAVYEKLDFSNLEKSLIKFYKPLRAKNLNGEIEPVTVPEVKPQPEPEKKPVTVPETKSDVSESSDDADDADDLLDALGFSSDEPEQEENSLSATEKMVKETNDRLTDIEPGQVVVIPDLPNAVYHGTDGISSTKIKDACVSLMYYNGVYNTGDIEKSRGTHFDVGNLAHTLTLEPEQVECEYIKKPETPEPTKPQREKYDKWVELGKPTKAENAKAYPTPLMLERCEFWDSFMAEHGDVIIVDEENWDVAQKMADAAHAHPDVSKILNHPARKSEQSYYKMDEETGLIIKVRPDIEVGQIIGDLKTIQLRGNPDEQWLLAELRREVKRRKYNLSAAMYLDVTGKQQFVWIFVNKEPGYHWVAIVRAGRETLDEGYSIYRDKLNAIAKGYETGHWPQPISIEKALNPETEKLEYPEV